MITVGDLVNGYNDDAQWNEQAAEYSRTMAALRCPWFPVAGNHDLYYRGKDPQRNGHDANFERHFGPLWYAFAHKIADGAPGCAHPSRRLARRASDQEAFARGSASADRTAY